MGEDKFNEKELYYQIDGGEFKLLPIKPLTTSDIEIEQSKLDVDTRLLSIDKMDFNAVLETSAEMDEIFKSIVAIQQHFEMQNSLYIICEMAKRYLYLLKEKETGEKVDERP